MRRAATIDFVIIRQFGIYVARGPVRTAGANDVNVKENVAGRQT